MVVPTRRGSASAIQILISHLFGDAGSPYLIGLVSLFCILEAANFFNPTVFVPLQVSDSLRNSTVTAELFCPDDLEEGVCEPTRKFYSMQYSLIINILIVFLGAVGFFITAVFIVRDKERVERYVAGKKRFFKEKFYIFSMPLFFKCFVLCIVCQNFEGFYFSDASSGDLKEKEDMIKSENNSTWSSEDDNPPILVLSSVDNEKKLNPLLPLAYKKNKSHN